MKYNYTNPLTHIKKIIYDIWFGSSINIGTFAQVVMISVNRLRDEGCLMDVTGHSELRNPVTFHFLLDDSVSLRLIHQ